MERAAELPQCHIRQRLRRTQERMPRPNGAPTRRASLRRRARHQPHILRLLLILQLLHGNAKPSLADSRFRVAYDDARFFDAATGSLKPFNSEDLQRALRDFV